MLIDTKATLFSVPCTRIVVASFRIFQDRELEDDMTKPYSVAFKQKMVEQLTGRAASNAAHLAKQTGVRQQNL